MATIAVTTANRISVVGEPECFRTLPAAEAIVAGAPVRMDTTAGTWTNANGTSAAEARVWGIATKTVPAGMPVMAVRRGFLSGFTLGAYDSAVYLSDTDGRLDTAAGTVSVVIGRVISATGNTLGSALDKILHVDL